jgi:hypothetical protein
VSAIQPAAISGINPGEERYALAYLAYLARDAGADRAVAPSTYGITPARARVVRKRIEGRRLTTRVRNLVMACTQEHARSEGREMYLRWEHSESE